MKLMYYLKLNRPLYTLHSFSTLQGFDLLTKNLKWQEISIVLFLTCNNSETKELKQRKWNVEGEAISKNYSIQLSQKYF